MISFGATVAQALSIEITERVTECRLVETDDNGEDEEADHQQRREDNQVFTLRRSCQADLDDEKRISCSAVSSFENNLTSQTDENSLPLHEAPSDTEKGDDSFLISTAGTLYSSQSVEDDWSPETDRHDSGRRPTDVEEQSHTKTWKSWSDSTWNDMTPTYDIPTSVWDPNEYSPESVKLDPTFDTWYQTDIADDGRGGFYYELYHPQAPHIHRITNRLTDFIGTPWLDCRDMVKWCRELKKEYVEYKKAAIKFQVAALRYGSIVGTIEIQDLTMEEHTILFWSACEALTHIYTETKLRIGFLENFPCAFENTDNKQGHINRIKHCLEQVRNIRVVGGTHWERSTLAHLPKHECLSDEEYKDLEANLQRIEAIVVHLPEEYEAFKEEENRKIENYPNLKTWEERKNIASRTICPRYPELRTVPGVSGPQQGVVTAALRRLGTEEETALAELDSAFETWKSEWAIKSDRASMSKFPPRRQPESPMGMSTACTQECGQRLFLHSGLSMTVRELMNAWGISGSINTSFCRE